LNSLAKNIKKYRKLNKISQKALADYLNVTQSSIAHYENGDRQPTLESIMQLSKLFSISIDELLGHKIITQSHVNYDHVKSDLLEALIQKNEDRFNQIINKITENEENLKTIENLMRELLYKIGDMWEFGQISVADEHYMSNLFRSVVYNKVNKFNPSSNHKRGIALASHHEQHTLGIELVTSLLKRQGVDVFYLGNNVPYASLKNMVDELKPDFILISITMRDHVNSLVSLVNQLKELNKVQVIIGGQGTRYLDKQWSDKNIQIVEDMSQILKVLD
jgi:methanogenic corrinoid protein MtbC1